MDVWPTHGMENVFRLPRRLVLVDQENLSGTSPRNLDSVLVRDLAHATVVAVGRRPGDTIVVAANHRWTNDARPVWRGADCRPAGGRDGADEALCQLATDDLLGRFTQLWIVSGDHMFADPARRARRLGLHVTVMSRRRSLARQLRLSADSVKLFSWAMPHPPVAA